ncbi:MAG: Stp1/IreP family PP2C-type Ser/Thr phosphatase [Gemmatimonadetes bacterium]|nr:Stp1/IreP family PP2C-type Ser/Thr phosphatase [Gemmatimonadota bacterium]
MHITCAARTDLGLIRSGNEDNFLMIPERGVFAVADGMGGHAAGEIASEMAVTLISRDLGSFKGLAPEEAALRMTQAIRGANTAIFERTLNEADKRGMGTTATVLVLHSNRYVIGQVGDSRAYLLRDGVFHQLTKDHSYVQEQVDAGYLTPEQARTHPYANVITRCVGANGDVQPDVFSGTVRASDLFLLASDGLTGMIEDEALQEILVSEGTPERWVERLVAEANRRGGLDNITAVMVQVNALSAVPDATTTTAEMPAAG